MMINFFFLLVFFFFLTVTSYFFSRFIIFVTAPKPQSPLLKMEEFVLDICGLPRENQNWKEYLASLFIFHLLGLTFLFILLFLFSPMSWHVALNTACSFLTNTNWQTYAGEEVLSPLLQMLGLGTQNFLSAAVGIVTLMVFARGLSTYSSAYGIAPLGENNKKDMALGNFWRDIFRITLFLLLPISLVLALFLVGQGMVQTFSSGLAAQTFENIKQWIPLGPVASQVAIKMLGTNGGGYFGVNAAHPFENPSIFSNFLQLFALLFVPASLVWAYGEWVKKPIHGAYLFFSMMIVVFLLSLIAIHYETHVSSELLPLMEGKEWRFGKASSALWDVFTTVTSNGAANSSLTSTHPITIMLMLFNMMLGGIFFGGVGTGTISFALYLILTIFLCGLMVGRTPEYLGKKIEVREMQLALVALLAPGILILLATALIIGFSSFTDTLPNRGPHLLSEIIYAVTSTTTNNGSALNGFPGNYPWVNVLTSLLMLLGRFLVIVPAIILGASFIEKKHLAATVGSLQVDNAIFMFLNLVIIFIVGALNYFPTLLLAPILEHLLMLKGITF